MGIFTQPSKVDRLIESIDSHPVLSSATRSAVESALASGMSAREAATGGNGARAALEPLKKAGKPGLLLAAGAVGITAASAAISSLRHRRES